MPDLPEPGTLWLNESEHWRELIIVVEVTEHDVEMSVTFFNDFNGSVQGVTELVTVIHEWWTGRDRAVTKLKQI